MNQNSNTHVGHISPVRVYLLVGAALLIFTAMTVKVSTIQLGPWNAVAALAIASAKALLVALFFMHLLYDRKMYAVVVSSAVIMLGFLLALTMADILKRGDIYPYQSQPIKPQAEIYSPAKPDTSGVAKDTAAADTGAVKK